MALIKCPNCDKQISSKAKQCSHCKFDIANNNEYQIKISHIKRSHQLLTQTFIMLTLFIAGVVIWFWGGEPAEGIRAYVAGGCFIFGFIGYFITRIRLLLHKRKSI